jgi:hypothetical protein
MPRLPVSPLVVSILFALICVGAFLVGLRFFRMTEPPEGTTVEQVQRFGRLLMMASTGLLLFLIAAIVHGDLNVLKAARG